MTVAGTMLDPTEKLAQAKRLQYRLMVCERGDAKTFKERQWSP